MFDSTNSQNIQIPTHSDVITTTSNEMGTVAFGFFFSFLVVGLGVSE